jgi:hypothetical protein
MFGVVVAICHAQDDRPIPGAPLVRDEAIVTYDASRCMPCHAKKDEAFEKDGVYKFIQSDCATIWKDRDPHSRAAERIDPDNNAVAKKMADALGYNVKLKPECLTCHAVDVAPTAPLADKKFSWKNGVSCESCHGMASQWFGDHTLSTWRKKLPAEKEQLGMVDLRDSTKRTSKCATCHIGSSAEGKFVTHEMYAAGHPPLLPFEPATFGRDQPQHWLLPEKVEYFQTLSAEDALKFFHVRKGEEFVPRLLATGSLATLRDSAKLLADEAEKLPANGLLDFAHFDCFACHKELVPDSVRLQAGYGGMTPGRPPMRPLPVELTRAILANAQLGSNVDQVSELIERIGNLRTAFDRRPFGDNKVIVSAARQLEQWANSRLPELEGLKYDAAARQSLLRNVFQTRAKLNAWDYDSAQHMTWAARALGWYDQSGPALEPLKRFVLLGAGLPQSSAQSALKERLRMRYSFEPSAFEKMWATILP